MIWFIVPAFIVIGLAITFGIEQGRGVVKFYWSEFWLTAGFGGMMGLALVALFGIIANIAFSHVGLRTAHRQIPLVALQDTGGSTGRYFLGIGGTTSNLTFNYYQHDADGLLAPESVTDEGDYKVRVDQTATAPYVEEVYSYRHNHWLTLDDDDCVTTEYIFHVPPGTIQQNYTLDAK